MDVDAFRVLFDRQVRARVPEHPPIGAVVEWDGPVARTHYGTHGTVTHPDLPDEGVDDLIARQVKAFVDRGEPVEWKVYAHGTPADLGDRLVAAGFAVGWTRQVLVADTEVVGVGRSPGDTEPMALTEELVDLVTATGPHRVPLTELVADGRYEFWDRQTAVTTRDGRLVAAGWIELLDGTDFAAIGGMTEAEPAILANLCAWAGHSPFWRQRWRKAHIVAEADGELAALLVEAGFVPVTSVSSYHLALAEPPSRERPVVEIEDPEYQRVWDRFDAEFQFRPGINSMPAITEPAASVTWHLGALDGNPAGIDELQRIVERGLRACTATGENLYWLDWQHPGYRFDLTRVGGAGQPEWPGMAYPDGDYYLYLTPDLRLGTFGHPWERSLCVFGADLLAAVEDHVTSLLGHVLRRGSGLSGVWG